MIVKCSEITIIYMLGLFTNIVNGRIYFADGSQYYDNRPRIDYTKGKNGEQASRDVDVTFSAGSPVEYDNNVIFSDKKNYFPVSVPDIDAIRENDVPIYLYNDLMNLPIPRDKFNNGDLIIDNDRKKNKNFVNFHDGHKIEIVLQLHVFANDD